jgi:hypothetical protein
MSLGDVKTWAFGAATFARRADDTLWFEEETITTVEPILDSNTAYVDTGGTTVAPLPVTAYFDTDAERNALLALRGTTQTITNGHGLSRSALLVRAVRTASGARDAYAAALTFQAV